LSAESAVRLRMHSGVPIVDVLGEWEPCATAELAEMIGRLAGAGHYEIVINVQRAALKGVAALEQLSRWVQTVREHCGHIDVVGTAEQLEALLREQAGRMFRLATCEETALSHIKRTPVLATGIRCTARPAG